MVAAILAGGAFSPSLCRAINIPLSDPSFDAYTVSSAAPPSGGYAYANEYRPTSGWVDDLDSPSLPGSNDYLQDAGDSNWIYNTAYADYPGSSNHLRAAPRTGNQAMHGLHNYNAQEVGTTFAAEKVYTFSAWAQGDADAIASDDRVWLYVFNGNVPFKESNALTFKQFQGGPAGDFNNRGPAMNAATSKANWKQVTVTHVVYPGASEIGAPIGVGFYVQRDAAIDDLTLDVDDAANHFLVLEVNTTNGQVRFRNQTAAPIKLDWYDIKSSNGALSSATWLAIQQQAISGFPAGNGSGNGWEKAGGSNSTAIGESYLLGSSSLASGGNVGLGTAYTLGGTHDIVFEYGAISASAQHPTGDYNDNGVVDAGDYDVWRKALNQNVTLPNDSTPGTVTAADFDMWRAHFGEASTTPPSVLTRGLVHYVTSFSASGLGDAAVPEPGGVILAGLGMATCLATRGARRGSGKT
jgi:hypothetical protein